MFCVLRCTLGSVRAYQEQLEVVHQLMSLFRLFNKREKYFRSCPQTLKSIFIKLAFQSVPIKTVPPSNHNKE